MTIPLSSTGRRDRCTARRLVAVVVGTIAFVAMIALIRAADASDPPSASYEMPRVAMPSQHRQTQYGWASWYGPHFEKRKTASGERFSSFLATAAHRGLRLGTWVRVTNLKNGLTVTVRVNDRGPYVAGRIIDLSFLAAHELAMTHDGLALVRIDAID